MAQKIIEPFFGGDMAILDELHEMEEEIDTLDEEITKYLVEIGKQDISEDQAREVYQMMHVTKQFEHIADIVDKVLRPLAKRKADEKIYFSDSGKAEVEAYHLKMSKQISRALVAFQEGSLERARKMAEKQKRYVALAGDYRQAHFERLRGAVQESIESSEIHLELMDCLRRMNSNTDNIARAMLMEVHGPETDEEGPAGDDDASRSA
jgi:phosphate:Na+ symporter